MSVEPLDLGLLSSVYKTSRSSSSKFYVDMILIEVIRRYTSLQSHTDIGWQLESKATNDKPTTVCGRDTSIIHTNVQISRLLL